MSFGFKKWNPDPNPAHNAFKCVTHLDGQRAEEGNAVRLLYKAGVYWKWNLAGSL